MKLSKLTVALIVAAAGSANAAVTVTGTAALTSDYMFRGISQTVNKPAVQGSFTATHDSGLYFTAWGSSINGPVTTLKTDSSGLELDTLFGYGGSKGDLTYDIGVMRYNYPGADKSVRTSFNEAYASATYKGAKLGAAYSDDYFGETGTFTYVYADYAKSLNSTFGVIAHVGLNSFSNDGKNKFLFNSNDKSYVDYKLGANASFSGVALEVAYIGSDSKAEKSYGVASAPVGGQGAFNLAEGRVVATLSKAF